MCFRIVDIEKRQYLRVVVGILAGLVGITTQGRAQDAVAPSALFHVGDRIALTVNGPISLSDTLVVRDGLVVSIPRDTNGIGDISLKGVRRGDVQAYLTQQIGRLVKKPVVHAVPLLWILVSGSVAHPSYCAVPPDEILSDVVMQAGGPTASTDLRKIVIQRGGKVFLNTKQTSVSLDRGETVADLQLMSGDQILVGEQSHHDVQTYVQIGGILLGLAGVVLTVARH
ncbi:MAG TPA: polysaccharide biosynthesis/export family protein [Gemmatimonadaceae bacterium]|jgi:protein involved in polysaccharide export with SLBB domain|nr:polysaccharide biosynthesis/export family protein [Gemmatimonadaceae bacterium]